MFGLELWAFFTRPVLLISTTAAAVLPRGADLRKSVSYLEMKDLRKKQRSSFKSKTPAFFTRQRQITMRWGRGRRIRLCSTPKS